MYRPIKGTYQQGDLVARRVKTLPQGAVRIPMTRRRRGLLVEGEATGHAHVATADDVTIYIADGKLFADMPSGSAVVHKEHNTEFWAPGIYEIGQIREKDLLEDMVRPVID